MSDLIQKARKEWCEQSFFMTRFSGEKYIDTNSALRPCPPEVVAALLDVLSNYREALDADDMRVCCGVRCYKPHEENCSVLLTEAAISRALEQKL